MKKIISLVLMVAMLFSLSAFAEEEEFTLHSGVKFGMTLEEVKTCEENAGFTFREYFDGSYCIEGKIAGIDESQINYYFVDGALVQGLYTFPVASPQAHHQSIDVSRADYAAISDLLNEKYGVSEYCTLTSKIYPVPSIINDDLICSSFGEHDFWKHPERAWAHCNYATQIYEEWLIYLPDGSGVYIHHCLYGNTDGIETYHKIYYTIYDAETISEINDASEKASSDL